MKGAFKKTLKNILFITLPTIFIVLILLEVFFRTLIPAADKQINIFDEKEKIYLSDHRKETGTFTIGKFAEIKTKWRINNMGWNYPIDYYPLEKDKQLIAVIGDSYIEALSVNMDKNYPFLLRMKLTNTYEVYAFGKAGNPLSEYLHISRYVNKHFNPNILIFNIVHNDFDESIRNLGYYNSALLQVFFNEQDSIIETIPQQNYSYIQYSLKKVLFKSALFRYFCFNLKFNLISRIKKNDYEANINSKKVKDSKELIYKATNYLVKTIKNENRDKRIIFIMDAPRGNIYDNTLEKCNVLWLNAMMNTICINNAIEFIDLTPFMKEDYRKNKIKFNSDLDGHWNEYGHKFVANVLYEYLKK